MYKDKQEYKKFIEDMENTKFASVSSEFFDFYVATLSFIIIFIVRFSSKLKCKSHKIWLD